MGPSVDFIPQLMGYPMGFINDGITVPEGIIFDSHEVFYSLGHNSFHSHEIFEIPFGPHPPTNPEDIGWNHLEVNLHIVPGAEPKMEEIPCPMGSWVEAISP